MSTKDSRMSQHTPVKYVEVGEYQCHSGHTFTLDRTVKMVKCPTCQCAARLSYVFTEGRSA